MVEKRVDGFTEITEKTVWPGGRFNFTDGNAFLNRNV